MPRRLSGSGLRLPPSEARGRPGEESLWIRDELLERDWDGLAIVDFQEIDAGRMAAKHALRGFDAIHLSAVLLLASDPTGPDVWFSSFDS